MSPLFTPVSVGALTLPNRIIMAPMTRSRADERGIPSELVPLYYAQRAGAGLIISEMVVVDPIGKGYERIPGIWNQAQASAWCPIADAVHAAGGRIFMQLVHNGRVVHPYYTGGRLPVGPSAINAGTRVHTDEGHKDTVIPQAMSEVDIDDTVAAFEAATRRAMAAGFDGVELHAASGYLHHQFLHPVSNRRADTYGGSARGRIRFVVETLNAMVGAAGRGRVGVKLSPMMDFNGMGADEPEETYVELLRALDSLGLAYVYLGENTGKDWPSLFRANWRETLFLGGGFTRASAEEAVSKGRCEAVVFGQAFLANPDLVERLQADAPLTEADPETFYTPGPRGYIDYPTWSGRQVGEANTGVLPRAAASTR